MWADVPYVPSFCVHTAESLALYNYSQSILLFVVHCLVPHERFSFPDFSLTVIPDCVQYVVSTSSIIMDENWADILFGGIC